MAEERFSIEKICRYCGTTNQGYGIRDDGIDWLGHKRGMPYSTIIEDATCNCEASTLMINKIKIKAMCLNCVYYEQECCTSKKQIDLVRAMSAQFDIRLGNLPIKNSLMSCEYYELNRVILDALIDVEQGCDENWGQTLRGLKGKYW